MRINYKKLIQELQSSGKAVVSTAAMTSDMLALISYQNLNISIDEFLVQYIKELLKSTRDVTIQNRDDGYTSILLN